MFEILISALASVLLLIIIKKLQRCIQSKKESKEKTPDAANLEKSKSWFWDKLTWTWGLLRPWIDKEDMEKGPIFIPIKILLMLIYVRLVLPVGIDILSIIF